MITIVHYPGPQDAAIEEKLHIASHILADKVEDQSIPAVAAHGNPPPDKKIRVLSYHNSSTELSNQLRSVPGVVVVDHGLPLPEMRVVVRYPGYDLTIEEELYLASKRRPDQAGEQIHHPSASSKNVIGDQAVDTIHFPELAAQQVRVLTYFNATPALATQLRSVPGVEVQTIHEQKPQVPAGLREMPPTRTQAAREAVEKSEGKVPDLGASAERRHLTEPEAAALNRSAGPRPAETSIPFAPAESSTPPSSPVKPAAPEPVKPGKPQPAAESKPGSSVTIVK